MYEPVLNIELRIVDQLGKLIYLPVLADLLKHLVSLEQLHRHVLHHTAHICHSHFDHRPLKEYNAISMSKKLHSMDKRSKCFKIHASTDLQSPIHRSLLNPDHQH